MSLKCLSLNLVKSEPLIFDLSTVYVFYLEFLSLLLPAQLLTKHFHFLNLKKRTFEVLFQWSDH